MKSLTRLLIIMIVTAGISAIQLPISLSDDHHQAETKTVEAYYPPPESAGGWRCLYNDEEVCRLAGFDPKRLDFVAKYHQGIFGGPWAIVIIRRGYLVREWYAVPALPTATYNTHSCTKSATGIAYGLLLEDSRNHRLPNNVQIDLDSRVYPFIPEGHPLTDPLKEKITLRHLLTMTSGIPGQNHGITGIAVAPGGGAYEIALGKEANRFGDSAAHLFAKPGEAWDYSDAAFAQLSLIFSKVAGKEIAEYMKERVFQPIGIEDFGWDRQGGAGHIGPHTNAHSGLRLTARDFARLGYLLGRGGVWKNEQIIPKRWIDLATRSSQDLNPGYGYSFWVNTEGTLWPGLPKDAFYFNGYGSNRCYVVPSLDLVVVRLGYAPPVWDEFVLLPPVVRAILQ